MKKKTIFYYCEVSQRLFVYRTDKKQCPLIATLNFFVVLKLRESRRKRVVKLEAFRRKRAEINDLINKEIRCRDGAQNLLK